MAYNKAIAENEWHKIKENEEYDLRRLGFSEEFIAELRMNDWEMFKSDRRYYERKNDIDTYENQPSEEAHSEIHSVQDLLDNVDRLGVISGSINGRQNYFADSCL